MNHIINYHIAPSPSPRDGRPGHKESFSALLIRHEIAYDIHFFTYKVARISFAESADDDRKEVVLKKTTADWLDRHITTAIAKLRKDITFCCPRSSRMATDEILESPHQFLIPLAFDKEWNGDPQTLCDNIHDYVVKQCIADWSQYALPARSQELQSIADDALREVHDIACQYTVTTTSPFI